MAETYMKIHLMEFCWKASSAYAWKTSKKMERQK